MTLIRIPQCPTPIGNANQNVERLQLRFDRRFPTDASARQGVGPQTNANRGVLMLLAVQNFWLSSRPQDPQRF
jgi:hypothetical protein